MDGATRLAGAFGETASTLVVSVLHRTLDELVAYPPHDRRHASAEYRRVHHHLVYELDAACWVCGVRHSQGGEIETHHAVFEWASQNGLDLTKVTADWPNISDKEKLAEWVDSEANMLVLCSTHHRGQHTGIHMISYPAWLLQRYQDDGWTFISQPRARVPLLTSLEKPVSPDRVIHRLSEKNKQGFRADGPFRRQSN